MWFLGHAAVAYAYALPFLLFRRNREGIARVLILVPFFANLPDFFHLDAIRPLTHNVVGAVALAAFVLIIWGLQVHWEWPDVAALVGATFSHLLADYAFGSVYLLAPFSWRPVGLFSFNGNEDLVTEAILGVGVLIVLAFLLRRMEGPRELSAYGGWVLLSPSLAVFMTSLLFWAEVYVYVEMNTVLSGGRLLTVILLAELVVAALLTTAQWVSALWIHFRFSPASSILPADPP